MMVNNINSSCGTLPYSFAKGIVGLAGADGFGAPETPGEPQDLLFKLLAKTALLL